MGFSNILPRKDTIAKSGALRGSKDIHTHILYGVDDGVQTLEESLAALGYEESLGVTDVWCTPHIMVDLPNETQALKEKFEQMKDIYNGAVTLHLGAEYMIDELFRSRLKRGDILTINEDTLLIEISLAGLPYGFETILNNMMSSGYNPLLAHPERYLFLRMDDYHRIRDMGVRFQLNIASLTGWYGKAVRERAETLLLEGIYSVYGSDCHSVKVMTHQYSDTTISREMLRRVSLIGNNI